MHSRDVILCLCIDEMLIVGSDDYRVKSKKNILNLWFEIKDMRPTYVILKKKNYKNCEWTHIRLVTLRGQVIWKINKDDNAIVRILIDTNHHLSKNKREISSQFEYATVIESLMHLMSCTRPDIAFSIDRLNRYKCNPREDHYNAVV